MKLNRFIKSLIIATGFGAVISCQDSTIEDTRDNLNNITATKKQMYIYEGDTLYEQSNDIEKLEAIFSKSNLALFSSITDPDKIFVFNSKEDRDLFSEKIAKENSSVNSRTAGTQADVTRYFIFFNGIGQLPTPTPERFDIFQVGRYNYTSNRYELTDLRNLNYAGITWNDAISSMRGIYGTGCPAFDVVVWEDPNFAGNSWRIYISPGVASFVALNLHDVRMTSRKKWGDNISSIFANTPWCFQ